MDENKVVLLNIDDIIPNRFQPRIKFNDKAINELAESIKQHGVFQPIVVRKISDKYEIIAGERRYKASIIAGKSTIPALITSLDDKNSAEVALLENIQRQDLTPIEEAISYKKILDMGYISQGELGKKLGKNQSTVANKLRLLNLDDEVQEALMENKISERHARSLLRLDNKSQILMLNRIVSERLTVRKTDEEINKMLNNHSINEKGENKMNENEIKNEFNIPTAPIIEPEPTINNISESIVQSAEEPETLFEEIPTDNISQSINPGFMDVDKIKNEAQDIVTSVEPVAPAEIDKLLKPDESIKSVQPMSEQIEVPTQMTEEQQGGKFFNMFNINNNKDSSFVSNVEEQKVNMEFGETKGESQNIFENPFQTQISNNTEPIESINQPSIDNNEQNVTFNNISEEPTVLPVEPMNSVDNLNQTQSSVSSLNTVPQFETQPIQPENLFDFSQPVQPFTLDDDENFGNPQSTQPSINPQPEIIQPEVTKSYMMDDNVSFDEDGEIKVNVEKNNERYVTADMKTVINTIRDCAATIEKFGYKIETDEIDLADSYEVTFKIDKI